MERKCGIALTMPYRNIQNLKNILMKALKKQDYVEYLLDTLLSPDMEERAALIASYGKEVRSIERRMAELDAGAAAGRDGHHRGRPAAPER